MQLGESILKVLFGIVIFGLLGSIALAFIVISDISEFQERFIAEDKLFILDINGNIRGAFTVSPFVGQKDAPFHPIDQNSLYDMTELYIGQDYDQILGDRYKLFIFHEKAFDSVEDVNFNKRSLRRKETIKLLKSADILNDFESGAGFPYKELTEAIDEGSLRYYLFARLVFTPLEERGPMYLIEEIKKGNIEMYPNSITFRLLKKIPLSFIEPIITDEAIEKVTASAK